VDDAGELHASGAVTESTTSNAERAGLVENILRLVHQAPEIASKPGVLDRQLLDAGEQDPIDALLAPEVLETVLVEPSHDGQQDAPFEEHDELSENRAMAREAETGLQLPLVLVAHQGRKKERVVVARLHRVAQDAFDDGEQLFVGVLARTAPIEELLTKLIAEIALEPTHQRLDADGGFRVLGHRSGSCHL